jgi:hypothetical protein
MTERKVSEFGMMKFFIIIMSALLVAGIAQITVSTTLVERMREAQAQIDRINRDYTPMFVVNAIIESNYYRSDEIMAVLKNDPDAVKEVQRKYAEFQLSLTKMLSSHRTMSTPPTKKDLMMR